MSVGRKTARAAVWAFFSTAGSKAITLVGLALLARLLAPREFGLLAFAMVYITYAETIGDLGSGMALVYWPDRRNEAAQVTFVVNAVAGVAWCLLTLAIAPLVAQFFHAPQGAPIVRALAIGFILKYLGNTHDALAQKDLRFRARLIPDLALAGFKAIVSLVLAWMGFGAWSLVWGHLAGTAARTLLLWFAVPWRPSLSLPLDLFKPMLSYGRGIITINVLASVVSSADLLVVGRFLGATALGLYQMAEKVPEASIVVLVWVVSKVLFPAFAQLHAAGESLRRPYLLATRYVSTITVPSAIGLFLLADPIILTFFGPKWAGAAPILGAFAVYAGFRSISTHAGDVFKATGHTKLLARLSFAKAVATVPALLIGVRYGAAAVATSLSIVTGSFLLVTFAFATKIIGVTWQDIGKALAPSLLAGAAMAAILVLVRWWTGDIAPVAQLGLAVPLGIGVYAGALRLVDPEVFRRARGHFLTRELREATR